MSNTRYTGQGRGPFIQAVSMERSSSVRNISGGRGQGEGAWVLQKKVIRGASMSPVGVRRKGRGVSYLESGRKRGFIAIS